MKKVATEKEILAKKQDVDDKRAMLRQKKEELESKLESLNNGVVPVEELLNGCTAPELKFRIEGLKQYLSLPYVADKDFRKILFPYLEKELENALEEVAKAVKERDSLIEQEQEIKKKISDMGKVIAAPSLKFIETARIYGFNRTTYPYLTHGITSSLETDFKMFKKEVEETYV